MRGLSVRLPATELIRLSLSIDAGTTVHDGPGRCLRANEWHNQTVHIFTPSEGVPTRDLTRKLQVLKGVDRWVGI